MKNGASSDVYEGKRQTKKCEKIRGERRGKKIKRKKMRRNKRMRDSPDPGKSGLSHFEEGFPKVLRKWIPGFGGRK